MSIVFRRVLLKGGDSQTEESRSLGVGPITFGSAAHCDMRFDSKLISAVHGRFFLEKGQLYCEDLDSLAGIAVAQKLITKKRLNVGDEIRFGDIVLLVSKTNETWVLTYQKVPPSDVSDTHIVNRSNLGIFDFRLYFSSLLSGSLLLSILMALLLAYFWTGSRQDVFSIGPYSKAHTFIGKDCSLCHIDGIAKIPDTSCTSCHELSVHGASKDADSKSNESLFAGHSCVDCHFEHLGDKGLIVRDNRQCVECHGDLSKKLGDPSVKDVNSISMHPEFNLPLRDEGKVKLNHEVHLQKDLRGEGGVETLSCSSCHSRDSTSGLVTPVTYEENCSRCHTLEFDVNYPGEEVPHASPDSVFSFLLTNVMAYSGSNGDQGGVPSDGLVRVRPGDLISKDDAEILHEHVHLKARKLEKELFERTACVLCHEMDKVEDPSRTKSAYRVSEVKIPSRWLAKANFTHKAHEFTSCDSCHKQARSSTETSDVLLPGKETCLGCHSDDHGASTNCITCHSYHNALPLPEENKIGVHLFD